MKSQHQSKTIRVPIKIVVFAVLIGTLACAGLSTTSGDPAGVVPTRQPIVATFTLDPQAATQTQAVVSTPTPEPTDTPTLWQPSETPTRTATPVYTRTPVGAPTRAPVSDGGRVFVPEPSATTTLFFCNGRTCAAFTQCRAAEIYLALCPDDAANLDPDGDGIPCEDIC